MTTSLRSVALLAAACALWAQTAAAQTASQSATSQSAETRPATTTIDGDTGLWYVPTGEVLGRGKWSVGGYRTGTNYVEGFTNVADFSVNLAAGVLPGLEVFGSWRVDTRIDRDLRPLFTSNADAGGVIPRYPYVKKGWSGDNLGDLYVGLKANFLSEANNKPYSVALREIFKLPTGDKDAGVSTGKFDTFIDLVVSKNVAAKKVEVAGYGGVALRGQPDNTSRSNGFRYGVGAGFPYPGSIKVTAELQGELLFDDTITVYGPLIAEDGSIALSSSKAHSTTAASVGLTWQSPKGFFAGGALTWNLPTKSREDFTTAETETGDFVDFQVRIGYHPGVRIYVPPPPPPSPAPAPAAAAPAANRPPTVTARCEPCTVEVGKTSTVTGDASDPDGDTLMCRWSAPSGTFQNPADRQTVWTAPQQEGPVLTTITCNDGKGGTASASVTIQVVRPAPVAELTFEDVYFDFDRSTLRPEALRLLDEAVTKLQANPGRNIVIEGHTCNIGTAEYNLALGDRRARSVMNYLQSRGVAANRLEVVSYGEERPKFDNAREETRRLNRRAALVVKVQ